MTLRTVLVGASLTSCALVLSACSDEPAEPVNPLTGLTGEVTGPVQAVKIDNTPSGWPQQGLNAADVVYIEQVEGQVTRLMAIYASERPSEVYPVRSARESDLDLLGQYGDVILTYSGANDGVQQAIDDSPFTAVSEDQSPELFGSVPGRVRPYQTSADVAMIADTFPDAAGVKDVGFVWDSDGAGGAGGDDGDTSENDEGAVWDAATPAENWQVSFGKQSTGFTWDSQEEAWMWWMQDAPMKDAAGGDIFAKNVIVQYSDIEESKYVDVTGAFTPYTSTVGSGDAVIFRDGESLTATWERKDEGSPTEYRTADGRDVPLAPGGVWVLLAPKGNPINAS